MQQVHIYAINIKAVFPYFPSVLVMVLEGLAFVPLPLVPLFGLSFGALGLGNGLVGAVGACSLLGEVAELRPLLDAGLGEPGLMFLNLAEDFLAASGV